MSKPNVDAKYATYLLPVMMNLITVVIVKANDCQLLNSFIGYYEWTDAS